jgi:AcrR family transcriptional regulator
MNLAKADTGPKRGYRMAARAEAAAATREAIVRGFWELFLELPYEEVTLDVVATRGGVTAQTVIRHFGSKEGLFAAAARDAAAEEGPRRAEARPGDVAGAVKIVVAHYERVGDVVLRLLAQEDRFAAISEVTEAGRELHYDWVSRAFSPFLDGMSRAARRRRHAQLVTLTDVFVWRLLRRDLGFSRRETEISMTETVEALLNGGN